MIFTASYHRGHFSLEQMFNVQMETLETGLSFRSSILSLDYLNPSRLALRWARPVRWFASQGGACLPGGVTNVFPREGKIEKEGAAKNQRCATAKSKVLEVLPYEQEYQQ